MYRERQQYPEITPRVSVLPAEEYLQKLLHRQIDCLTNCREFLINQQNAIELHQILGAVEAVKEMLQQFFSIQKVVNSWTVEFPEAAHKCSILINKVYCLSEQLSAETVQATKHITQEMLYIREELEKIHQNPYFRVKVIEPILIDIKQ
ncbi:hypothetical protein PilKf_01327 [Pillotina sp. SPG140]